MWGVDRIQVRRNGGRGIGKMDRVSRSSSPVSSNLDTSVLSLSYPLLVGTRESRPGAQLHRINP